MMPNGNFKEGKYFWNESYVENRRLYLNDFENYSSFENTTSDEDNSDYVFDRLDVRISFIIAYSIVFCCCVFGNLMVILLVSLNRRLKSTTNFFLANLAFADFCVGIFCVFQNLTFYLVTSWVFGDFLCKMNQFIHGLSCTASIFILVVICTERYLAINHPIRCKQILTKNRLRWYCVATPAQPHCGVVLVVIITLVWTISSAYSMPRYLISQTISNPLSGSSEIICIMSRMRYNSQLFDVINFVLLYLLPLGVMSVLYSLTAVRLWHSGLDYPIPRRRRTESSLDETSMSNSASSTMEKKNLCATDRRSFYYTRNRFTIHGSHYNTNGMPLNSKMNCRTSKNILYARRRVVRMLIIIVLTFAVCNLPFHARKMWQYWSAHYDGTSTFSSLFTPITFLCTYCNSAINPLLYAFLSKNFQKSMKEFFGCRWKGKHERDISIRQKSSSKFVSVSKNRRHFVFHIQSTNEFNLSQQTNSLRIQD